MKRAHEPPSIPTWILRRLAHYRRDALIGDLSEEYQKRESRLWYWREVLWAVVAGMRGGPLRRFGLGAFRLLIIGAMLVGASVDQKWPLALFALDPSFWSLSRRIARKRGAMPSRPSSGRSDTLR